MWLCGHSKCPFETQHRSDVHVDKQTTIYLNPYIIIHYSSCVANTKSLSTECKISKPPRTSNLSRFWKGWNRIRWIKNERLWYRIVLTIYHTKDRNLTLPDNVIVGSHPWNRAYDVMIVRSRRMCSASIAIIMPGYRLSGCLERNVTNQITITRELNELRTRLRRVRDANVAR